MLQTIAALQNAERLTA